MSVTARTAVYDGDGPLPVLAARGGSVGSAAVVGDRGRVRALAAWAARTGLSADSLWALDTDDARLDPAEAARLETQLRRCGQVMRAIPVAAVGWTDPGSGRVLGGAIGAQVGGEGVLLRSHGTARAWACAGPARVRVTASDSGCDLTVAGWARSGTGCVTDAGGVLTGDAAEVLLRLADAADVAELPATSVVAGLLTTLRELSGTCARSGEVLVVGSGRP